MKVLVTGGGGFLGGAICRRLRERDDEVRSFSRGDYPALREAGIEAVRGDIADADALSRAVEGMDVVLHVAAKAGIWGSFEDYLRVNVTGTKNVIEACVRHKVPRLVYTSSPSVVFNGRDMEGADENVPYPARYEAPYPQTKAMAEQLVLGANGPELSTVALRPHLIWGPGDTQLVPRIIAKRKSGALRKLTGDPKCVDSVYIDNAVDAHTLAADKLKSGAPMAGKAYFITNGEPLPVWTLIDRILAAAHLPPVEKSISPKTAYAVGAVLETIYGVLGLRREPRMTRFLAKELSTAHWFNISAAHRDLGYEPKVSIEEGLRRLESHLNAHPST